MTAEACRALALEERLYRGLAPLRAGLMFGGHRLPLQGALVFGLREFVEEGWQICDLSWRGATI